uniref:Uncharacterized protein n=1 Tax=Trypanosoma congolense (strain IL3000) TaxID=1068625 RepID=G0UVG7_TRYCI|nr:conserved hypothetical protein [Trypanosoma congolense IL3000]
MFKLALFLQPYLISGDMFRRKLYHLSSTSPFVGFTTKRMIAQDPQEHRRESELRQRVLKSYGGLHLPEFSGYNYGHFSTGGPTTSAAIRAKGIATDNTLHTGASIPKGQRVDWLMFLTGVALLYVSTKMLIERLSGGAVGNLVLPSWVASIDEQANHLLFVVQYDKVNRERVKEEYAADRKINPFITFFQWLAIRHPEYGHGSQFYRDVALNSLSQALSSGNQQTLLALATNTRDALSRKNESPAKRIDYFISKMGISSTPLPLSPGAVIPTYSHSSMSPNPLRVFGTENETIQTVLDVTPSGSHGSVPFR